MWPIANACRAESLKRSRYLHRDSFWINERFTREFQVYNYTRISNLNRSHGCVAGKLVEDTVCSSASRRIQRAFISITRPEGRYYLTRSSDLINPAMLENGPVLELSKPAVKYCHPRTKTYIFILNYMLNAIAHTHVHKHNSKVYLI